MGGWENTSTRPPSNDWCLAKVHRDNGAVLPLVRRASAQRKESQLATYWSTILENTDFNRANRSSRLPDLFHAWNAIYCSR